MNKINFKIGSQRNKEIAAIFIKMADCYRFLGEENRFRAVAYENVAKKLYNMKENINDYINNKKGLEDIKGIGESIAEKIIEYLTTGKMITFEELKKKVPIELLELIHINQIGPSTLNILYNKLGIKNKAELENALKENKLNTVLGIGIKRKEQLLRALKLYKLKERILLKDAKDICKLIVERIKGIRGVQKVTIAGSIRRKCETVGDIDMVIVAELPNRERITNELTRVSIIEKILIKGKTKVSFIIKERNIQVDCRIVSKDEYGAALLYFTGSKEHNIALRSIAKERGYKINEYGLYNIKTNEKIAGENEAEIYRILNLPYIEPEKRINMGELEIGKLS